MMNTATPSRWLPVACLIEVVSPESPVVFVQWEDVLGEITEVRRLYRDAVVLVSGTRGSREMWIEAEVLVAYH